MSPGYRRSLRGRLNHLRYLELAGLVGLHPGERILDLGCGTGWKSVAAHNRSNPILGVDLVPDRRFSGHGPNFDYLRADARDLSMLADGSFDVVLSFGLLEHVVRDEDARAVLAEAARVGRRYAHLVPHRLGLVEPHFRLPLLPLWPPPLRRRAIRAVRRLRGRRLEREPRIRWRSAREWRALSGDPGCRTLTCWYGPAPMYLVITGGEGIGAAGEHRPRVRPVWLSRFP